MAQQPPPAPRSPLGERAQNFLLYGFLISIALHLIVGPFIKFERSPDAPEKIETVRVDKMPTPPPTPKPTPKPTPTPTPPPTPPPKTPPPSTPRPQPPQAIKINTLQQNSKSAGGSTEQTNTHTEGSTVGVPQGVPSGVPSAPPAPTAPPATPAPTPVPTPTPLACANPNVPPKTVSASYPDPPAIAQQQGLTGEVYVVVSLGEDSKQNAAPTIQKSTNRVFEKAALDAARQSRFQTEVKNCKPQASKYVFIVEFQQQ